LHIHRRELTQLEAHGLTTSATELPNIRRLYADEVIEQMYDLLQCMSPLLAQRWGNRPAACG